MNQDALKLAQSSVESLLEERSWPLCVVDWEAGSSGEMNEWPDLLPNAKSDCALIREALALLGNPPHSSTILQTTSTST